MHVFCVLRATACLVKNALQEEEGELAWPRMDLSAGLGRHRQKDAGSPPWQRARAGRAAVAVAQPQPRWAHGGWQWGASTPSPMPAPLQAQQQLWQELFRQVAAVNDSSCKWQAGSPTSRSLPRSVNRLLCAWHKIRASLISPASSLQSSAALRSNKSQKQYVYESKTSQIRFIYTADIEKRNRCLWFGCLSSLISGKRGDQREKGQGGIKLHNLSHLQL